MTERGDIFSERAYALGKMLDNSSWLKDEPKLPRLITPSDIDLPFIPLAFDNDRRMLLCELSRDRDEWAQFSTGQRLLYEALIHHTWNIAICCRHNITPEQGRRINTRYDVQSFQLMVWDFGIVKSRVILGNGVWQRFVFRFYQKDQPEKIRRWIIGKDADLAFSSKTESGTNRHLSVPG